MLDRHSPVNSAIQKTPIIIILFLSIFVFVIPQVYCVPSITYNSTTNIITVNGYSEGTPCNFWEVWNASNVNGWGVVNNNNDTQYELKAKLDVLTWFIDSNVQVFFSNASITDWFIRINAGGHFRMGTVINSTAKTTSSGVDFLFNSTTPNMYAIRAGYGAWSYASFYSCNFKSLDAYAWITTTKDVTTESSPAYIWNCVFENIELYTCNSDYYNSWFIKSPYALRYCQGTFNRISYWEETAPIYFYSSFPSTIINLYAREHLYIFRALNINTDKYIIDAEVDNWNTIWVGTSSAEVWRQYTFKINVTNINGNPIENANVTLTDIDGIQEFSVLTGVNGSFNERIVNYGFYNQTGGDTPYLKTPHNLTITHANYEPLSYTVYIDEWKTVVQIVLHDPSGMSRGFVFGGILAFCLMLVLGLAYVGKKT